MTDNIFYSVYLMMFLYFYMPYVTHTHTGFASLVYNKLALSCHNNEWNIQSFSSHSQAQYQNNSQ